MKLLFKRIGISIALIIICVFIVQFYQDYKLTQPDKNDKNSLMMNHSTISGYQDGKRTWTILVKEIIARDSQYFFSGNTLHSGKIFDGNGQVVVDNMQAEEVNVNSKSKTLSAKGHILAEFIKRDTVVPGGVQAYESRDKPVKIKADELRYFSTNKRTYLYSNVVIGQGNARIYTQSVEVDNDKNIAYIDGAFTMKYDDMVVSGNQMVIYIDEEYSEILGKVRGYRNATPTKNKTLDERERTLKSQKTSLECDYLKYESGNKNEVVTLKGHLLISQKDKNLKADSGLYDRNNDSFLVEGNIRFQSQSLAWLLRAQNREKLKNKDIKAAITMPTDLTCTRMLFDSKNKIIKIVGDIRITQKDKVLTCQQLEFDDKTSLLGITGNTKFVREKKDTLTADELLVNLDKEEFSALSQVQTEFRIKKKSKE